MSPSKSIVRNSLLSFLPTFLAPQILLGDESSVGSIEEIIVTADFRNRNSTKIPSSISILDRETIEQSAVQHFEELIYMIPNLNWSGDGNRGRNRSKECGIRGS